MKTKIAISSHIGFYEKTYPIIVNSLLNSGVNENDIYFFIGGCEKYEKIDSRINLWKVDHNSIDFTGLISVLDLELTSDRWFLLHDTLYVGSNFYSAISNKTSDKKVINMSRLWPKNMGSYSQSYLEEISETLLTEYKNKDLSLEYTKKFKEMNVKTENRFLLNEDFFTEKMPYILQRTTDFYSSNTMRDIQHYPEIDIYKIQSSENYPGNYNIKI